MKNLWQSISKSNSAKHAAATATKLLQSCPTLCDPIDGSPPGSPFLGFSRQEHWSGLPFPSPMHESEKWKGSSSVVSDSSRPHGLQPTRLLCPWDFPGKSTGVGCHCLLCWWQYQDLTDWWLFIDLLTFHVNIHTFYCALECFPQELCSIWLLCSSSWKLLNSEILLSDKAL